MQDVRQELSALRRRMRLQSIMFVGAITVAAFAAGGADAVARVLVTDGWSVSTKNAALALTPRLSISTDVDVATVAVSNANIALAQQTTAPSSPAAGTLWYDSNAGVTTLKVYNGTAWTTPGAPAFREFPFVLTTGELTWTNQPAAVTELINVTYFRKKVDLASFSQFRMVSTQSVASSASGAKLRMEYSLNGTSGWTSLESSGTGADLDAVTAGDVKVGTWGTIASAAKVDVWLRIVGLTGGSGSGDPRWRMIAIQVK